MAEKFGTMPTGETVLRTVLDNGVIRASVLSYGAVLQSIEVPDREGRRANVALGFATLPEYLANGGHFGAVPGRYAGRIANGRFTLDGTAYQLAVNKPPHTVHGGNLGFGKRNWTLAGFSATEAELTLTSPEGEEGFPGLMLTRVRYTLDGPALRIDYHATTDHPTILNLTNHSYFNLGGEGEGDILGHTVTLESGHYLPIAPDGIPTGEVLQVDNTPFDFREPCAIGTRIRTPHPQLQNGLGYDHAYVLPGEGLRHAALLQHAASGRRLAVATTEPVMHFYTGNNIAGGFNGMSGRPYGRYSGVCFEAEHPQDSPNQPGFASTVLRPGTPYTATTIFRFGADPA